MGEGFIGEVNAQPLTCLALGLCDSHGEGYADRELEADEANPIGALVLILGADPGYPNSYPLVIG